jgi:hypothetical protein
MKKNFLIATATRRSRRSSAIVLNGGFRMTSCYPNTFRWLRGTALRGRARRSSTSILD